MASNFTPTGLISSLIAVGTLIGLAFAVDGHYIARDAAASEHSQIIYSQQQERVETDISLIDLEVLYLEDKIITAEENGEDGREILKAKKRLAYLEKRKETLEKYQLELQPDD